MKRRLSIAGLLSLFCLSAAVRGESVAPAQLEARWTESTNLHLAHQGGAINHLRDWKVTLKLLPGGKLLAEDSGLHSEHNLYPNYSTAEESKWSNAWSGTWSAGDGALHLALTLSDRSCTKSKTISDQPSAQKLTCATVSKQIRFECSSAQVSVESASEKPSGPSARPQPQTAWRCTLAAPAELADTPLPWLFGQKGCIQTIPGISSSPALYRTCSP